MMKDVGEDRPQLVQSAVAAKGTLAAREVGEGEVELLGPDPGESVEHLQCGMCAAAHPPRASSKGDRMTPKTEVQSSFVSKTTDAMGMLFG
jgi:hypothetical protein